MEGINYAELIEAVTNSLGKLGGYLLLIIALLWTLYKTGITKFVFDSIRNKVENKRADKHMLLTIEDLRLHSVFIELKSWRRRKINSLNFKSTVRNDIFRDIILYEKTCAIEEVLSTGLIEFDIINMKQEEFGSFVLNQIDIIIMRYEKSIQHKLELRYDSNKNGQFMFDFVMNSPYKGFNNVHSKNVDVLIDMVHQIVSSQYIYDNNIERYWSILNVYSTIISTMYVDLTKSLSMFNGDLTSKDEEYLKLNNK